MIHHVQTGGASGYEAAKIRLIEHVRSMKDPPNKTALRKEAEAMAKQIETLAIDLGGVSALLCEVEEEHDSEPESLVGRDGMRSTAPAPSGISFQATLWAMRDLARSFQAVAGSYPDPRTRPALPAAALGLVALWYEHGKPRPSVYAGGDAVRELAEVCQAAGLHLSDDRYKGALSKALGSFDPTFSPPWVHFVLTGRWDW